MAGDLTTVDYQGTGFYASLTEQLINSIISFANGQMGDYDVTKSEAQADIATAKADVKAAANDAEAAIAGAANDAKSALSTVASDAKTAITATASDAKTALSTVFSDTKTAITSATNDVGTGVTSIINDKTQVQWGLPTGYAKPVIPAIPVSTSATVVSAGTAGLPLSAGDVAYVAPSTQFSNAYPADLEIEAPLLDVDCNFSDLDWSQLDDLRRQVVESSIADMSDYWDTYFPESSEQFGALMTKADQVLTSFANGSNLDALYLQARDQIEGEYATAFSEAENLWASRGFNLPSGMLTGVQYNLRKQADLKMNKARGDILAKQVEQQFQQATTYIQIMQDSRNKAIQTSIQYLQGILQSGLGAVASTIDAYYQKQTGLVSATSSYYSAQVGMKQVSAKLKETLAQVTAQVDIANINAANQRALASAENSLKAASTLADIDSKVNIANSQSSLQASMKSAELGTQVAIAGAEISSKSALAGLDADVKVGMANADMVTKLNVQKVAAVIEGFKAVNEAQLEVLRTQGQVQQSVVKAEQDAQNAVTAMSGQVQVESVKAVQQAQLSAAQLAGQLSLQGATLSKELALEEIKGVATRVAAALNALHTGASINASAGVSNSYSESQIESI